jgi:ribonuclease P protein component
MPSIAREITRFSKKEIDYLFQRARRVLKHPAFVILLAPRQREFGHILIIASRKVGNAPERNKIRRQLKSIFYEEKLFEHPFDVAIIVHKYAVDVSFDQLKELLMDVYKKEALDECSTSH